MDKKKYLTYGTGILLAVVGLGAMISGIWLMVQPDGTGLKLSTDLLENSPFNNYFIPGMILFAVNGVLNVVGAFLTLKHHRFSGIAAIILGAAMLVWISSQVYWIGWESWLQPFFLIVGVVEIILGLFLDTIYHENRRIFKGHHGSHAH